MLTRSQAADLLEPGLREVYDDAFQEEALVYPSIFNVLSSSKQDETDSGFTGFKLHTVKTENASLDYDDPIQMYDVTYVHDEYALGFKVSEVLWEDDQYNVIKRKAAQLCRSARRTQETSAANVFNNAFTSTVLGGDAQELVSTTHPRSDGGSSQSNASATGITLTDTNLETARIASRQQLDDRGMIIQVMPDLLVVPVDLEKTAEILIGSSLRPGTADNDLNFYQRKFQVVPWEYLTTNNTMWFLIDKSQHKINWFWRVRNQFKNDSAFDTGALLFKSRMRYSVGFSDWRGVWGSLGGGAAYAG
jgi:phage major head subunit gpT-like protein